MYLKYAIILKKFVKNIETMNKMKTSKCVEHPYDAATKFAIVTKASALANSYSYAALKQHSEFI
jgi:hypothetical protein